MQRTPPKTSGSSATATCMQLTQLPKRKLGDTSPDMTEVDRCTPAKPSGTLNQLVNVPSNITKERETEEQQPNMCEVGQMKATDLMKMMSSLLDQKIINLPTKADIDEVNKNIGQVKTEVEQLKMENTELKDEIKKLKESQQLYERRVDSIQDDLYKKKIIIKGLENQDFPQEVVINMLKEKLNIEDQIETDAVRKLFVNKGKMTVLVEMRTADMALEILKRSRNLAGSSIYIERDLPIQRRKSKKMMLVLRRSILTLCKDKKVQVRGDALFVDGKSFKWRNNILMCDDKNGKDELVNIYGSIINDLCVDYNAILCKVRAKN